MSERNKKLVRQFFNDVVNQHDASALNNFVRFSNGGGTCGGRTFREMVLDPDVTRAGFLGRKRLVPGQSGKDEAPKKNDLETFRDFTEHVLQAFPDMKVKIVSIFAEGDQVIVRWTATATHKGEFLGTAATGRKVPWNNVDIFTVKDGKIVEVDAHPDTGGLLSALGHLPDTPLAQAFGAPPGKK